MAITKEIYNSMMQNKYLSMHPLGPNPGNYETRGERIHRLSTELAQAEASAKRIRDDLDRMLLDEPINGPTQRELNSNEALNTAWREFNVIWKLTK